MEPTEPTDIEAGEGENGGLEHWLKPYVHCILTTCFA